MKHSESATSPIFALTIEEIIKPGTKLELFAPDYMDDLPEAKELGIGFQAISMHYRAMSRVPDVWIMYQECTCHTVIPGYPEHSGTLYSEQLRLTAKMPEFKRSIFAPELSPTLESGLLYVEASLKFGKDRRLVETEIRHNIGNIRNNKGAAMLSLRMIELVSRDAQEFLK
ncbi:MAG TPA: hypothetical protein VJH63_03950 [Candidatus Paceibacterota bacterium]